MIAKKDIFVSICILYFQVVQNLCLKMSIHFLFFIYVYILEKEMATHSSILAWKILWTEEPGRLQFLGLQRVGHNWVTNTFTSLSITLVDWPKKTSVQFMSKNVLPMFLSRNFTVSRLRLKSVSHFEFILVYGMRVCSNFWFTGGCPAFPMSLAEETFIYCIILPSLLKIN